MIRDITRACLTIAVMAAAAGLLVEVRYQLAAIDAAHRSALHTSALHTSAPMVTDQQPSSPLRRLGRAGLDLADATLGIIR